ncbi:uncharacterized protein C22orf15 [Cololabis saira]|uniref:uncharacterized protein C22orf15 n=1 Tax=Cololabis saira TaxID=129043 RepID=UPI002AD338BA|nr:uncharacterized protein C22orf15 [Cololabis saira]
MFVTILHGDGRTEMMNLNCRLINFIHHLKEKSGVDFKDCVDLMDSRGHVVELRAQQRSLAAASSVLAERQRYVLLRVCRDDGSGSHKYVPLLNNYSQSHPELIGLLKKLANPGKPSKQGRMQRTKNISSCDKKQ